MGIKGLDEMIEGGVPEGHILVLKAPTGGGKTTTALQFAYSCLQQGLSCIFISSNMDVGHLMRMGKEYGWGFEKYVEEGLMEFKFMPPIVTELEPLQRAMRHDSFLPKNFRIEVISERFEDLIQFLANVDSKVVIVDSLSEFLLLVDDKITKRGYVLHIYNIIKKKKATALINLEEEVSSEEAEIFADGIIRFHRIQSLKRGEVNYLVEIIKMRLTNHSKEIKEYKITSEGIKIFSKYSVI
jgi:KaiC/GvpD/RAD55 family RecA-like ATPase